MSSEISIIVPVYNVERYLSRCIESILLQSFPKFDLILVDDGSPDKCASICDDYAKQDDRIHVIHQTNCGLSAARNAGIDWVFKHSNSSWLTFIDSDDWVHPEYLSILFSAVVQYQSEIAIGGFYKTVGEKLPELIDTNPELCKTENYYYNYPTQATVAWGKIYHKKCFESIRFPVGKIHEDEYIIYKILFQYKDIPVVKGPIYAYFQNNEGIMKRDWNVDRLDIVDAVSEQVAFFLNQGYMAIAKRRFVKLMTDLKKGQDLILQCDSLSKEEKKHYRRILRKRMRRELYCYWKYQWIPFRESERNKQIYMYAFPIVRVSRNMWGRIIKPALMKTPIVSVLFCKKRHRRSK